MAGHTYSKLLVHVVFGTKDRRARIRSSFRDRLYQYMAGIAKSEFGHAVEIGGTEDHIHALISLHTRISVAEAVRKLKSLSTGWIHKTFPDEALFAWQEGYGAFTVSESNVGAVVRYIRGQADHHKKQAFSDEFAALLRRHRIAPAAQEPHTTA